MEIKVQKLSYKDLKDLTFTIEDKQITGITGSGKSSLLKLIKARKNHKLRKILT